MTPAMTASIPSANDKTILVIDADAAKADNVRELIEFMDMPSVITAIPADWRERLGERRLEAMFVGPELTDSEVAGLVSQLEEMDPNVPIVMMQDGAA